MSWRKTEKDIPKKSWRDTEVDETSNDQQTSNNDTLDQLSTLRNQGIQGLTSNFLDEIEGATSAALRPLGITGGGGDISQIGFDSPTLDVDKIIEEYTKTRDARRKAFAEQAKRNPGTATVGQLVGGAAQAAIPVGVAANATKGASLLTKLLAGAGTGAAQGAASSLGASEAENLSDIASDTLMGAGVGATLGTAFPVVGAGMVKAFGKDKLLKNAAADYLAKSGLAAASTGAAGAGVGYMVDGTEGAEIGGGLGALAGLGITTGRAGKKVISELVPEIGAQNFNVAREYKKQYKTSPWGKTFRDQTEKDTSDLVEKMSEDIRPEGEQRIANLDAAQKELNDLKVSRESQISDEIFNVQNQINEAESLYRTKVEEFKTGAKEQAAKEIEEINDRLIELKDKKKSLNTEYQELNKKALEDAREQARDKKTELRFKKQELEAKRSQEVNSMISEVDSEINKIEKNYEIEKKKITETSTTSNNEAKNVNIPNKLNELSYDTQKAIEEQLSKLRDNYNKIDNSLENNGFVINVKDDLRDMISTIMEPDEITGKEVQKQFKQYWNKPELDLLTFKKFMARLDGQIDKYKGTDTGRLLNQFRQGIRNKQVDIVKNINPDIAESLINNNSQYGKTIQFSNLVQKNRLLGDVQREQELITNFSKFGEANASHELSPATQFSRELTSVLPNKATDLLSRAQDIGQQIQQVKNFKVPEVSYPQEVVEQLQNKKKQLQALRSSSLVENKPELISKIDSDLADVELSLSKVSNKDFYVKPDYTPTEQKLNEVDTELNKLLKQKSTVKSEKNLNAFKNTEEFSNLTTDKNNQINELNNKKLLLQKLRSNPNLEGKPEMLAMIDNKISEVESSIEKLKPKTEIDKLILKSDDVLAQKQKIRDLIQQLSKDSGSGTKNEVAKELLNTLKTLSGNDYTEEAERIGKALKLNEEVVGGFFGGLHFIASSGKLAGSLAGSVENALESISKNAIQPVSNVANKALQVPVAKLNTLAQKLGGQNTRLGKLVSEAANATDESVRNQKLFLLMQQGWFRQAVEKENKGE